MVPAEYGSRPRIGSMFRLGSRRIGTAAIAGLAIWIPSPRTTWQWQLTTPVDQSVAGKMFDIDLFDNSAAVVGSLHRRGRRVVCYLDAGTYEDFRPDAHKFPKDVLGRPNGWPGE